jgi:hypothetical protein
VEELAKSGLDPHWVHHFPQIAEKTITTDKNNKINGLEL